MDSHIQKLYEIFPHSKGWYGHSALLVNKGCSVILKIYNQETPHYFWINICRENIENVYFFSTLGIALSLSGYTHPIYIGNGEEECYFLFGKTLIKIRCKDLFDVSLHWKDFIISDNYNFVSNELWETSIFYLASEDNPMYLDTNTTRQLIESFSYENLNQV